MPLPPWSRLALQALKQIWPGLKARWVQQADLPLRTGFRTGMVALLLLGAIATRQERVWTDVVPRLAEPELHFLRDNCWITYDPTTIDPLASASAPRSILPGGRFTGALAELNEDLYWAIHSPTGLDPGCGAGPLTWSIRRDLRRIRAAGFTGIVTFGSNGVLACIPRIAKAERLAVIMGVWNPNDAGELRRAIAQQNFVDGYCVGHDGLDKAGGYDIKELAKAVSLIQSRTGRPATTSEGVGYYAQAALRRIGDWFFPDVQYSVDAGDSREALDIVVSSAKKLAENAAAMQRPLMLKMVTFPWRLSADAMLHDKRKALAGQAAQFDDFLDRLQLARQGLAVRPSGVVHSAFDMPWKTDPKLFQSWDPYTGVLELDGTERPAVRAITRHCS